MQHIVSVAFDFDDQAVSEKIQASVEKAVIDKITKDVEVKVFEQDWYFGSNKTVSTDHLSTWTKNLIAKIFEENKETIIDQAAKYLADSYKRTKAWKEATGEVTK